MPGLWYSFTYGHARFILLDTTIFIKNSKKSYEKKSKKQLKWLKAQLIKASEKREKYPWIIVLGHHCLYCSPNFHEPILKRKEGGNRYNQDCAIDNVNKIQPVLEPLLKKYGVDLYICGHVHKYERMLPIYKNLTRSGTKIQ
jgi:hypothetical protein